jgi:hypothetical protein
VVHRRIVQTRWLMVESGMGCHSPSKSFGLSCCVAVGGEVRTPTAVTPAVVASDLQQGTEAAWGVEVGFKSKRIVENVKMWCGNK